MSHRWRLDRSTAEKKKRTRATAKDYGQNRTSSKQQSLHRGAAGVKPRGKFIEGGGLNMARNTIGGSRPAPPPPPWPGAPRYTLSREGRNPGAGHPDVVVTARCADLSELGFVVAFTHRGKVA